MVICYSGLKKWWPLLVIAASLSACAESSVKTTTIAYIPVGSAPISTALPAERNEEQGPEDDNQPLAARVNNQPIFLATYQQEVARFEQTLTAQGVDLASEKGQALLAQVRRQVLEALIDQVIIEQQAAKLNIMITEEALAAKTQESIAQAQGQAQFEAWLAANDLTYGEFEATLRTQLLANQVFDYITQNISDSTERERIFEAWLMEQRSLAAIERYVAL